MLKLQTISRRGVFSLFGLGATLFAIPTTDVEAQIGRHLARPRRPLSSALRECDALLL